MKGGRSPDFFLYFTPNLVLLQNGCLFATLLLGGNANNGANAGLGNANTNNSPANTNANIGSRQCLFYANKGPGSCQKITNVTRVLVSR
jgi:hypothetical protein